MRFLRDILETLLLALIIFLLVQATVQSFEVQKHSMDPTLKEGQRLLINKAVYWSLGGHDLFHPPHRGEIVVLRAPNRPKEVWIKRVIGLPGDKVEIKEGQVYINGEALEEPYAHGTSPPLSPVTVPPDHYFVMGDNRSQSTDSSDWEGVGPIPAQNIIGKAWVSIWPPGRAPNYSYGAE